MMGRLLGWEYKKISGLGKIITGNTPPTSEKKYYSTLDIPFFKPDDFERNCVTTLSTSKAYISLEGAKVGRMLPKGSVLVTCIGIIGKIGVLAEDGCCNQQINAIIPDNSLVESDFLAYNLLFHKYIIESRANAPLVPIINKTQFSSIELPIPPLEIQQKIVAVLKKAEQIIQKRKIADTLMDKYLKSIFIEMFGDPLENSKKWDVRYLEQVADVVSGVTKGRKLEGRELVSVPYMRVANVQDGALNLNEIKTIDVLPSDVEKYQLRVGDLLMTEGGDPDKLGRCALWRGEVEKCIHQNHIFRVRVNTDVLLPEYLSFLVGDRYGKNYFLRAGKQTTGIATINSKQLKAFPILIPQKALQVKFTQIVNSVREASAKQKIVLENLNILFASLMNGMLEKR
jgi:type I restriction enzyme S subunit